MVLIACLSGLIIVWLVCKLPYQKPYRVVSWCCDLLFILKNLCKSLIQKVRLKIALMTIEEKIVSAKYHRHKKLVVDLLNIKIQLESVLEINSETVLDLVQKFKKLFKPAPKIDYKEYAKSFENWMLENNTK
jgi:hypothetical protein